MIRGFIFGSQGALTFSIIEIIVVFVFNRRFGKKMKSDPLVIKIIVTAIILPVMLVATWKLLLGYNSGAQRSKVDLSLLYQLTEEKLDEVVPLLGEREGILGYEEKKYDNMQLNRHYAYYLRMNSNGEYQLGSVNFYVYKYADEETARDNMWLFDHLIYDYYGRGEIEAYLGRSVIDRSVDTFYLGSTHRNIDSTVRVGSYIIMLGESTHSRYLNNPLANDVFRILIGE
ncbi:MAG: hypothetical protein FWG88_11065 [Oscillospiraceae bacterium]|nr:hypothetical protein [Oscillospiraceae bacterium]